MLVSFIDAVAREMLGRRGQADFLDFVDIGDGAAQQVGDCGKLLLVVLEGALHCGVIEILNTARVLDEDVTVNYNGQKYEFSAGTVLECDYIATLKGDHQQAAHSLNRRIEFLVLREDYVSRKLVDNLTADSKSVDEQGKVVDLIEHRNDDDEPDIAPTIIHDESTLYVTMINSTRGEITCIANGMQVPMLIDERYAEPIAISWEEAMNLLYQQRITKEDFPLRDKSFDPEGNILDRTTILFKSMQIGEQRRENIEVIVIKGIDYKFIINRTGLQQFGNYEFDKQRSKLIFLDE